MIAIQALCCLISKNPGVAHTSNLTGRIDGTIKCSFCDAEYRIEYNPVGLPAPADYENALITSAHKRIDHDHPHPASEDGHTTIINIDTISN
jgi:hypothetical protein